MVVFLVVVTVIGILAAEWYVARRSRLAREAARATPFDSTGDLYFHAGHSWVRRTPDGLVSVGASAFASNFAGDLAAVRLPSEGRTLHQGAPAWTLVSSRGRRLTQVMPVEGKVVAVNEQLTREPGLAQKSPLDEGWILRVRPKRLTEHLANLLHGLATVSWRETLRASVANRLNPALGGLAHDGGEWVSGFGDLLEDEDWDALRRDLFPPADYPEDE